MISLRTFAPIAGLLVSLGIGCTAVSTTSGDGVDRCDNVDDCPDPGDARYTAQCIKEDNDIPGVCVAAFVENIGCNGEQASTQSPNSALGMAWAEFAKPTRYVDGCADNPGSIGCPGPCADGSEVNVNGVCDDDNPNTPPAVRANSDLVGVDVNDQYCRSFFCDTDFVCRNNVCRPCEEGAPLGEGGCGTLAINGALSCVYTSPGAIDSQCEAPDSDSSTVAFGGDCPMP